MGPTCFPAAQATTHDRIDRPRRLGVGDPVFLGEDLGQLVDQDMHRAPELVIDEADALAGEGCRAGRQPYRTSSGSKSRRLPSASMESS